MSLNSHKPENTWAQSIYKKPDYSSNAYFLGNGTVKNTFLHGLLFHDSSFQLYSRLVMTTTYTFILLLL